MEYSETKLGRNKQWQVKQIDIRPTKLSLQCEKWGKNKEEEIMKRDQVKIMLEYWHYSDNCGTVKPYT